MAKRKQVLSDHTKRGRVLIPPFTALLGQLQDVSWVRMMIPELCWIALIHDRHGDHRAVEILTAFTRTLRSAGLIPQDTWLAPLSNYQAISAPHWQALRKSLADSGQLPDLHEALEPLVDLYSECPMVRLFVPDRTKSVDAQNAVRRMKTSISAMFDRRARGPMMAQASALWFAFDAGILKVSESTALAQFPKIQDYPTTELSKQVGAGIRSSLNLLFGNGHHCPQGSTWPAYFWNQGLTISPCESTGA